MREHWSRLEYLQRLKHIPTMNGDVVSRYRVPDRHPLKSGAEVEWKDRSVSSDFPHFHPFNQWSCLVRDIGQHMSIRRWRSSGQRKRSNSSLPFRCNPERERIGSELCHPPTLSLLLGNPSIRKWFFSLACFADEWEDDRWTHSMLISCYILE